MKGIRFVLLGMILAVVVLVVSGGGSVSAATYVVNSSNYTTAIGGLTGAHTVVFSPGTYTSDLTITQPLSLVSDTGDYRNSSTLFQANMAINSNGASVKGFVFDKDGVYLLNVYKPNVRIEKNSFVNSNVNYAIYGTQINPRASNLSIVDNYFANLSRYGVYFNANHNSLIEGNVFTNVDWGIDARATNNLDILNNKFNTEVQNANIVSGNGIRLLESTNVNIKGNVIQNSGEDGSSPTSELRAAIVVTTSNINIAVTGVIENNTLFGNDDGIVVCNLCKVNNPSYEPSGKNAVHQVNIINNSIHSNVGDYDLVHGKTNVALNASHNYWGGPEGLNLSRAWGNISYSPYYADESLSSLGFVIVKSNLTLGENVFQFNESGVVQNVSLDLSDNVSSARLVMRVLNSRPESTRKVSSSMEVYRYFEISDNISDSLVRSADVTFRVPKSWLDSHHISKHDVVLLRHDRGRWRDLDAEVVSESSDYVVFSAESSGFSFFAIAGILPVSDDDDDGGSSGGGSGGGRVTFTGFNRKKTATASGTVNGGVPFGYDLRSRGLSVREVRMVLNRTARNTLLTVSDLTRRSTTEKPSGDVHNYFGTDLRRVDKRNVEQFRVTFAVNKSWLSATGFEKDEVVLLMKDGNTWRELSTEPGTENPTEIEFSADASGPSVFAVTGRKKETEKVVIPETEEVKDETDREKEEVVPVTDEGKGSNFWKWFLWVLVAVVVLVVVVVLVKSLRRRYVRGRE